MRRRDRRLSTVAHNEAPPELVVGQFVEIWADEPRNPDPAPGTSPGDLWGGPYGSAMRSTRENYHEAYEAWVAKSGLTQREVNGLIRGHAVISIAKNPDGAEYMLQRCGGFTIADVPQLRRWAMARLGRPV